MENKAQKDPISKTGYDQIKWRPVGQLIALILSDDDLTAIGSKNAPKKEKKKKKESKLITKAGTPKLYKGQDAEDADKEAKKNNRTFTVAAISTSLAEKSDSPEVGDEISLQAGNMTEIIVDDIIYGCVPIHRVLGIHKDKISPKLDD